MSPRKRKCPYSAEIRQLLPAFSSLLSERQRQCLHAHHIEGLGLAQIARRYQISRQAVLDAVLHGEKHLLALAQCLKEYRDPHAAITEDAPTSLGSLRGKLFELRERIAREGIIYSPQWIIDEIDALLETLPHHEDNHTNIT